MATTSVSRDQSALSAAEAVMTTRLVRTEPSPAVQRVFSVRLGGSISDDWTVFSWRLLPLSMEFR